MRDVKYHCHLVSRTPLQAQTTIEVKLEAMQAFMTNTGDFFNSLFESGLGGVDEGVGLITTGLESVVTLIGTGLTTAVETLGSFGTSLMGGVDSIWANWNLGSKREI